MDRWQEKTMLAYLDTLEDPFMLVPTEPWPEDETLIETEGGGEDEEDTVIDPFPAGKRARALDPDRTLPPPEAHRIPLCWGPYK